MKYANRCRDSFRGIYCKKYSVGLGKRRTKMINFEKELKNFEPSLEVEEAESAIYNHDLTDVTDIITEILRDVKENGNR